MNHESKTEDFLFFVFKSVSRANTVNMNAQPLLESILPVWFVVNVSHNLLAFVACRNR
jgi:hypothetical protein